jgi:hypothetical protein
LEGPAIAHRWPRIRFHQPRGISCEYTIAHQAQEIDRLRAELRRDEELNGDADALLCLQRTYMDPRTSTPDRIKAAGAAIGYERPKISVQLQIGPAVLGERLDAAKAMKTVNPGPKLIEHQGS